MSLWLGLATALAMTFFLLRARRNYLRLPLLPAADRCLPPDVTVVIPARNEEGNILRVVKSLAPQARVIVVDDHSSDQTALRACRSGATVIAAPPLPGGFVGKPHACWIGSRHVTSRWVLFADADTCYDPAFLASFVAYAETESLDMASVFLRQERRGFAGRILLPYAFALYFCGVNGSSVNRPDSTDTLANGQCVLFRLDAYRFVGGHQAVAASLTDDLDLSAIARRHRLRTRVLRAEHLGSVRMDGDLQDIRRGFVRNSYRFLQLSPLCGAQVIAASVTLTSYLPVAALLAWEGWWALLPLYLVLPALLLAPWYGAWREGLLGPLAIYPFQAMALEGMAATTFGRKVEWKGRGI